jgi:hypothetical protein
VEVLVDIEIHTQQKLLVVEEVVNQVYLLQQEQFIQLQ